MFIDVGSSLYASLFGVSNLPANVKTQQTPLGIILYQKSIHLHLHVALECVGVRCNRLIYGYKVISLCRETHGECVTRKTIAEYEQRLAFQQHTYTRNESMKIERNCGKSTKQKAYDGSIKSV